jgi:hypothetical protein
MAGNESVAQPGPSYKDAYQAIQDVSEPAARPVGDRVPAAAADHARQIDRRLGPTKRQLPGNYTDPDKTELPVHRLSDGTWIVRRTSDGAPIAMPCPRRLPSHCIGGPGG